MNGHYPPGSCCEAGLYGRQIEGHTVITVWMKSYIHTDLRVKERAEKDKKMRAQKNKTRKEFKGEL